MTLEYIQKTIAQIEKRAGDNEAAHNWQDALYEEFIEYIATGNDTAAELAKEVLKVRQIDFIRWYA